MLRKSTWSLIIIAAIFILPVTLFTQDESSTRSIYKSMDKLLSMQQYEQAMPLIEQLLEISPDNANYNFKMAYAIIRSANKQSPLPYLEKAIQNITSRYRSRVNETAAPTDALWFIGQHFFNEYNYERAEGYLTQYLTHINSLHMNYSACEEKIASCKTGLELMKDPVHVTISDFSEATTIQSHFHSGLFSPDESMFIFTADSYFYNDNANNGRKAHNDDIYIIYKKNDVWSKPKPLSSNINSELKEASVGMHPNGKMLLVYREDPECGNLYYSDLIDSCIWSPLKKFPAPINSSANETHATISADGKVIYFTSDREGGYGGLDIYMSRLNRDGTWGKAINLGPTINSSHHEESPHFQANSNLLYFSSNRPGGMGGFDVYRAEISQDSIVLDVKNMGYPINTPQYDMFFKTSYDGGKAYYSSACTATNGEYDLQIVTFEDKKLYPNAMVQGLVITQHNDTLKNKDVYLFNLTTRSITDSARLNPATGYYVCNLHSKNSYFISVAHEGYVYYSKPFQLSEYFSDYTFENTIILDPIYITDSTLRQNEGMFTVFKNNLTVDDDDALYDTVTNVFAVSHSIQPQKLSRLQTTIDEEAQKQHYDYVLAQENVIVPTLIPENNELISDYPTHAPDTIDELSSIMQVVQGAENQPLPRKTQQKSIPKVVDAAFADSLLTSGVANLQFGQYNASENDLRKAKYLYDSLQDVSKQLVCLDYLTENQRNIGQLNNALELQLESLSLMEKNASEQEIAAKQKQLAYMYDELWYKDEAIDLFEKNLEAQKKQNNKEGVTDAYFDIADVYMQHNEQEKAIALLQESLEHIASQKKQAEAYNKIGVSYHQLYQYVQAIGYYNKAIFTADAINDLEGLTLYHTNIGNAFYDNNDLQTAMYHYDISLELYTTLRNERGIAIAYYNIGNVNKEQKKHTVAIENFTQSIERATKIKDNAILSKNYFALMNVYKSLANYKLALSYYQKYYKLQNVSFLYDSQISEVNQKYPINQTQIQLLETQMKRTSDLYVFEKRKYEQELHLLYEREKLLYISKIAIGIVLIGAVLLLILLLFRFRTRRKYYTRLSLQNAEILQKQEEITVQRENLETLNYQLEQLSIVASKTANAVAIITPNGDVEWVNDAFLNYYSEQPKSFFDFSKSEDEKSQLTHSIQNKTSVLYEVQRIQNESLVWIQCMVTPIVNNNELSKLIIIESIINELKLREIEIKTQRDEILVQAQEIEKQRDIAVHQNKEIQKQKESIESSLEELQITQKKLIESEKMASLGSLVAGISHEINTPVGIGVAATSSLSSNTESLKELFESRKMKQSDLQNYIVSTQEATNLIRSNLERTGELVKSFKRISVDEMTDQKRLFNMREYIHEVLTSLTAETAERTIQYNIDCPDDIEITNYPAAFAKIISNMMKNVLLHAYTKEQTHEISIVVRIIDNSLHFQFSDKGKGMSPDVVQKVFNPFFTTNMQLGKGLGMSVVYNTVTKQLNGEISCKSAENEGTSYHIIVPLLQ